MRRIAHLTFAVLATVAATASARAQSAAAASPVVAPDVGQKAPDFSLPWADKNGAKSSPVALRDLRGKVVVLAFYPGDRTGGCTAELSKFRDEYTKLFGDGVVVLPISVDPIDSHASWAKDMNFPFSLVADTSLSVAGTYGSIIPGRKMASRTVYVIGKDGKITYRELKFGALNEAAYQTLAAEVTKAKG